MSRFEHRRSGPRLSPPLFAVLLFGVLPFAAPLEGQDRPTLRIDGLGYLRYSYQLGTDSTLGAGAHANNFDVDRAYINLRGTMRHGISTRVTTDIDPGRPNTTQLLLRLKYAYVAWHPEGSALTWKLGEIQTPLIEWIETLWGFRMQGSVALDRTRYLTSSDFGLSVAGNWRDDGISLVAGVYNGEGYNGTPGDQHKDVAARLSVRLVSSDITGPASGLRLTGYGHLGASNGGGARSRFAGILSWQSVRLTLGGELAVTRDSTAPGSPDTRGRVLSAYGVYNLPTSPIALLARVDAWDPDTDREPSFPDPATSRQHRIIAGVAYRLTPDVRVMLDADFVAMHHGSPDNAFEANRRSLLFQTEFRF